MTQNEDFPAPSSRVHLHGVETYEEIVRLFDWRRLPLRTRVLRDWAWRWHLGCAWLAKGEWLPPTCTAMLLGCPHTSITGLGVSGAARKFLGGARSLAVCTLCGAICDPVKTVARDVATTIRPFVEKVKG